MKYLLKLEELAMLVLCTLVYFHFYTASWLLFVGLFLAPDLAFFSYLVNTKMGAVFYNLLHHKGVILLFVLTGYFLHQDLAIKVGLIFMAHSCFDRVMGYGLKFSDSFEHTHLGWIGKNKYKLSVEN